MSFKTTLETSVAKSFVFYILLFSSFAALISTSIQLFFEYRRDINAIEKTAEQIEKSHKSTISQALWAYNNLILESQLKGVKTLPGVLYACIRKDNEILKEIGTMPQDHQVISYEYALIHKVKNKELRLGTLEINISLSDVYKHLLDRVVLILIVQTLKTFLVSIFILFLFNLIVGRHLNAMANFAKSINLNNLENKFKLKRKGRENKNIDELGLVESALDSMRVKLLDEMKNVTLAQKALRKSEARFQLVMEAVSDGVWDWDIVSDKVFYSQGWAAILSEEVVEPTYKTWVSKIHPDDKNMVLTSLQHHLDGRLNHWEVEHRLKARTGDWKWVLGRGAVVSKNAEGQPIRMVGTMTDISERKMTEVMLQHSERRSQSILQANPNPVVVYDTKGYPKFINESFTTVFGWTLEEVKGGTIPFVPDDEKAITVTKIKEIYKTGKPLQFLTKRHTKSNDILDVTISAAVYKNYKGENTGMVVNLVDVTDQLKLEGQFRQAQKMESIGRLAGGVAHDFNNMLSIILGNIEILLDDVNAADPFYHNIKEIQKAALRSADLTRQLLAFARKQTISPRVLDLNHTIEGMLKMLKRLIGEDIDLSWHPDESLWTVKIDPSQVDQMLANLCVNARDSIKDIGKVTIETHNVHFDENYCKAHSGFKPGDYSSISVSDNGCGMGTDTIKNLFEPFFTTKGFGEGTGLGLATVYGIVKQNNGFINVYSEPGDGALFKIYLPRYADGLKHEERKPIEQKTLKGDETILLVEDDKAILKTTQMMLNRLGYHVLAANSPDKALQLCNEFDSQIDLLMTDVVMPSMNGRVLAGKISQSFPKIKVLYMSGYTANVIAHRGILDQGLNFINKPFSKQELSIKLREILSG